MAYGTLPNIANAGHEPTPDARAEQIAGYLLKLPRSHFTVIDGTCGEGNLLAPFQGNPHAEAFQPAIFDFCASKKNAGRAPVGVRPADSLFPDQYYIRDSKHKLVSASSRDQYKISAQCPSRLRSSYGWLLHAHPAAPSQHARALLASSHPLLETSLSAPAHSLDRDRDTAGEQIGRLPTQHPSPFCLLPALIDTASPSLKVASSARSAG